jgi:flagellar biosynthesis protein FliR
MNQDPVNLFNSADQLFANLPIAWTFMLLMARFTGLFLVLPGVGGGIMGMMVRFPAIFILSATAALTGQLAQIPGDIVMLAVAFVCEFTLGLMMGMIPMFIVSGAQTAGQIASSAMGLTGSQLFDPSAGGPISDVSRILGDLTIIVFLLLGGHYHVIYAVSGLGATLIPGTFIPGPLSTEAVIEGSAAIFHFAVMISAPVVVALLLTQFVMGLISKAVPTVNIFIISFPVTIGVGLMITILALPDVAKFVSERMSGVDTTIDVVVQEAKRIQ